MQFRDLKRQYEELKLPMDQAVMKALADANFISGSLVTELEEKLAKYVGVKHCISCGNGTDALTLALMAWNITTGDAVFVPDFTFFASGETVAFEGATPVFVDVKEDTFNLSPNQLRIAIERVKKEGKLVPKAIITVDLFGLPAEYQEIQTIAKEHNLLLLEDAAQGFGGKINNERTGSFGDIATTSFFPAKPLGCYGDGGAIFTNNDEWAKLIRSFCVHGKGEDKYDNVRIGMNSRLDTIQAAILTVKLEAFERYELEAVNQVAAIYTKGLKDMVAIPKIKEGFYSSWAQYSILLKDKEERDNLQAYLKNHNIPSMIYYPRPMHQQTAFDTLSHDFENLNVTVSICERILALPMHPYLYREEQEQVIEAIQTYFHSLTV